MSQYIPICTSGVGAIVLTILSPAYPPPPPSCAAMLVMMEYLARYDIFFPFHLEIE